MVYLMAMLLLLFLVWAWIHIFSSGASYQRHGRKAQLPPGPRPFPVIGNFMELGDKPHHSVATLSKTYGPIMTLKLGRIRTIVISSPNKAKEILQKHDHVFFNRLIPDAARALDHHKNSMVWLPLGNPWRNLRKICNIQLFTVQRLDATQSLRTQKVQQLLDHVHEISCNKSGGHAVHIAQTASTTSLNLLSNTFFSIDLAHYGSSLSQEFNNLVWGSLEEAGRPNISDYIPVLRMIDPQGIRRRSTVYYRKLIGIFDGIVDQRRKLRSSSSSTISSSNNDVLDVLLNLTEENDYQFSCNDINHLLMDLFIGGIHTTASTLEWAMAELLKNPKTMAKARNELQQVLGKDKDKQKPVQESDISSLPYLQAVVKETLRMHSAAPFLTRKADMDMEIGGFMVPKDAPVLINLHAIFRDPDIWSSPNSFVPERFLDQKIDFKGHDFEFIPFGGGRRICPGMPLAYRMVHLMLASLLHSFDWKLENGQKPEDMDMSDKYGIALQKAKSLRAIPIKV